VNATNAKLDQAATSGAAPEEVERLNMEKAALEARLQEQEQKNKQQQKLFEDWKAAADASASSTADGLFPTDIGNIQFRNGDCLLLKKSTGLEGIVLVRCVAKNQDGVELIGCDYKGDLPDGVDAANGVLEGEKKWSPTPGFTGVWLQRKDFKGLLPTLPLLNNLEKLQQEIVDLNYYKNTAQGFIKIIKKFNSEFQSAEFVTIGDHPEVKGMSVKGDEFAKMFMDKFMSLEIVD